MYHPYENANKAIMSGEQVFFGRVFVWSGKFLIFYIRVSLTNDLQFANRDFLSTFTC